MRNISSLNINIMGKYRSTKVGEDIMSDQDSAFRKQNIIVHWIK